MSQEMIDKIDKMNERIEAIESNLNLLTDELNDGLNQTQVTNSRTSNSDGQQSIAPDSNSQE